MSFFECLSKEITEHYPTARFAFRVSKYGSGDIGLAPSTQFVATEDGRCYYYVCGDSNMYGAVSKNGREYVNALQSGFAAYAGYMDYKKGDVLTVYVSAPHDGGPACAVLAF